MDSLLAVDTGGSFFFFPGLPVQSLLMLSLLSQRQGTPFPLRGQPNTFDPVSSFFEPLPSHCLAVIMHCASWLLPISQGLALFLGVACLSSNTRTRPRPALSDCPRESDIRRTDIITSFSLCGYQFRLLGPCHSPKRHVLSPRCHGQRRAAYVYLRDSRNGPPIGTLLDRI